MDELTLLAGRRRSATPWQVTKRSVGPASPRRRRRQGESTSETKQTKRAHELGDRLGRVQSGRVERHCYSRCSVKYVGRGHQSESVHRQ